METQLMEEFDYVLLGTNVENSILAAYFPFLCWWHCRCSIGPYILIFTRAFSRVGKKVLHIDKVSKLEKWKDRLSFL